MANYKMTVVSNCFWVKDREEVLDVFLKLGYEDTRSYDKLRVCVASCKQSWNDEHLVVLNISNNKVVTAINYNNKKNIKTILNNIIKSNNNLNIKNLKIISLVEYIQYQLKKARYMVIKEVGGAGTDWNLGYAKIITKDNVEHLNLDNLIMDYVRDNNLILDFLT